MNLLSRWRRPLLFVLLPLVLFYGTYFLSRYATFSLTMDRHSTVIRELIRSAVAQRSPRLAGLIAPASSGPNRSAGCSFLLLEEIWRDCKSITLFGKAQDKDIPELAEVIRAVAIPIVADPCAHITDATLIQGIDRHRFGCDGIPSPFRAVVRYASGGEIHFHFSSQGSIE